MSGQTRDHKSVTDKAPGRDTGASLKKLLFPVQRMAIIVASRAAAFSFFQINIFFAW